MQYNTQLAALLVVLCSGPASAGGGAGNNTCAANYTTLAAQLSALRLANSSNCSANSSGQCHSRVLHCASTGQTPRRLQPRSHHKKTASVVHGKKGRCCPNARQSTLPRPSKQGHHSRAVPTCPGRAHSSTGGPACKVRQSTLAALTGSHACTDSGANGKNKQVPAYRQKPRGYVLETRRQCKRRMARERDSTPLYTSNFITINANCSGHYHLAENIDVGQTKATLPLCNNQDQTFQGSLKGGRHTLRLSGSQPLFETLQDAEIDVRLHNSLFKTPQDDGAVTGLLAKHLVGHGGVNLSGDCVAMHSAEGHYLVGLLGRISSGIHTLEQSDFNALMSGSMVAGAVGTLDGARTNVTLTQTHCTFRLTHLAAGSAGVYVSHLYSPSRLILTQTNVSVAETDRVEKMYLFGGGVGHIFDGSTVLTQTAVNIRLASSNTIRDEGTAFGVIIAITEDTTVTLRLFSGTSTTKVCGSFLQMQPPNYHDIFVQGVIDTAGYAANATSCKTGNHNHTALKLLDTTDPKPWRDAHAEFCCSQTAGIAPISCPSDNPRACCHYPHEQLLITARAGDDAALIVSRQGYPYNNTSAEHGLLRVSRLQLNNLNSSHSSAEIDRSFGTHGTLLFAPGDHHQQLQPGRVLLALVDDQQKSLTLLCRSNGSDGTPYYLGTLSLNPPSDNKTVAMQPLADLKGEPVLLTLDPNGQACHIWTHEQHNSAVYRYPLSDEGGLPDSHPLSTAGPVIGIGTHNNSVYIGSCDPSADVVVQRVDPDSWQSSEPTPVAQIELTPSPGSDATLTSDKGTLVIHPPHVIWAQDGSDQQLKAWEVSELPFFGGVAQWRVSAEADLRLNNKACEGLPAPDHLPDRELRP